MSFAQWLDDMRWAMNVKRARAWRRKLPFSRRAAFDRALRHPLRRIPDTVVDYPDAFYAVSIDDLCRAMRVSSLANFPSEIDA
jgi:hypothetical protein